MENKTVCFNELSLQLFSEEQVEVRMREYVETLKAARERYGVKKVRYHANFVDLYVSPSLNVQQYCDLHRNTPLAGVLLSTFTMPFVDEEDDIALEKYCDTKVFIQKDGEKMDADGFNAAYCQGTFCVGFSSSDFWKSSCVHTISIRTGETEKIEKWGCLSSPTHIDVSDFHVWYDSIQPIRLMECWVDPCEKPCKIRDDHGQDILLLHAEKLLRSRYVTGVVNSLQFNSHNRRYIKQIFDTGIIHVVLFWTDAGYGLAIQTTGRNTRETAEISRILERDYGKK